jgi:hypothetical protein
MSSTAKLAANRANAQHSTGPNDTTKTRLNGLRHGLTGNTAVLPGESQEEYERLRAGFLKDLKPGSEVETLLADRIIAAAWRLKRFNSIETAFYTHRIDAFLEANPDSDADAAMANLFIDGEETKKMRLFMRYQNATQREYDKAMTEFRKAREERAQQAFAEAMASAREAELGFASQPDSQHAAPWEMAATTVQHRNSDLGGTLIAHYSQPQAGQQVAI